MTDLEFQSIKKIINKSVKIKIKSSAGNCYDKNWCLIFCVSLRHEMSVVYI